MNRIINWQISCTCCFWLKSGSGVCFLSMTHGVCMLDANCKRHTVAVWSKNTYVSSFGNVRKVRKNMILAKCLERSSLPRRFLSYLGRAEAVACPPNNFFNDNTSDNNTTNNNDATTNNNLLNNNNNNKAPPPRPPKPSRQALNLFQWRQQQEQEIERIRTFGHDSLLPPARYSPYCHCFFSSSL